MVTAETATLLKTTVGSLINTLSHYHLVSAILLIIQATIPLVKTGKISLHYLQKQLIIVQMVLVEMFIFSIQMVGSIQLSLQQNIKIISRTN
jgi:hypothetical protein